DLPVGRLTALTGVSGSGKSTLLLESLVPALQAHARAGTITSPAHVRELTAPEGLTAQVVDATPIGQNVRSTVATYSGVMDGLRRRASPPRWSTRPGSARTSARRRPPIPVSWTGCAGPTPRRRSPAPTG